jgi:glutamate-1-semialdehyde 2,1-aminomutase
MSPDDLYKFDRSEALMARARKVVPSGLYGHVSPALLVPGAYPNFLARGQGCHIWDVDGNEYIDFMCSYGPIVLGHNHPRVDEAARAQQARADCQNLPGEVWVELAELLVDITPIADWAVFAKNGSDVTSWSLAVARSHTRRNKVIMAAGAYHGAHPWCTPIPTGIPDADRANVLTFRYNDLDDLRRVAAENRGDVAALILCPFRHDAFHDSEMPAPGFHQGVRQLCDQEGIVLVLDDIRAGFRLHLGGSGELLGLRPDLTCYCKAIANGYALSVGLGREELRQAAQSIFFTGTFWPATVSMAAAIATINTLREEGGIQQMEAMGTRLRRGLDQQASSLGLAIKQTGPPAIPFMTFDADGGSFQRSRVFCAECSRRGVFFHPHHNWFLSAAHTEADIDQTLAVAEVAFKIVKEQFGS